MRRYELAEIFIDPLEPVSSAYFWNATFLSSTAPRWRVLPAKRGNRARGHRSPLTFRRIPAGFRLTIHLNTAAKDENRARRAPLEMKGARTRRNEEARKEATKSRYRADERRNSARFPLRPLPRHHRGERLIRNFGARVPRGNVLFGFPRATISFPPMQACQRRTIGGGGGGGAGDGVVRGWLARLRLHPPLPLSPMPPCLLAVAHYPTAQPILFGWDSSHSLYAVIARPGGDIGVRMDRYEGVCYSPFASSPLLYLPLPLSLVLFAVYLCVSSPLRLGESTIPSFVRAHPVSVPAFLVPSARPLHRSRSPFHALSLPIFLSLLSTSSLALPRAFLPSTER